jgi:DNA-binding transcriptional ArsR family regulator
LYLYATERRPKMARSVRSGRKRRQRKRRQRAAQSKELVDHQLMKALARQERVEALAILVERIASPKELARETGEDLSSTSYHVRVLRECGLIELDHKVPRRGAVEHFYRAVDRTLLPPDAWDNLPAAMRKGTSVEILQEFFDDARGSIEAGIFDDPASDLSWTPLILDSPGFEEVGRLTDDFLEAVLDAQASSTERLKGKGNGKAAAEKISATVFLASFRSTRSPTEGKKAFARKRL